ncbi:Hvo_1808 family surface protein [Halorussus halobius]|uniref:Hvo_1808 family surface protein n=1 Tax=Halorussus halobius TaxID=1710537 RepID=UPI001092051C|nr:Hvo_1808 family surface protein [Halorussus halobius]
MRTSIAVAVVLMLVVAGCSQAPGGATETTDTHVNATTQPEPTTQSGSDGTTDADESQAVVKPDDPETDVLGWEDGVWYNETIAVDAEDGLNDTELNRTVSRAMARVERIRGLEFDERVPVTIQTREQFRGEQDDGSTPADRRVFDNVKFESLFMIGEDTDSIAVQNSNAGSSVGGYYDPGAEEIVVVSENTTTPELDEITLSQELFHALQDQKFDFSSFNQSTRELHNAKDGLIEGDGNYVDHLYSQHCADEWGGDCLRPDSGGGGGGELANYGPYLLRYQPYSDGPAFVRQVRERGGWEAVNDLYEDPPASTEQVIHPEKYGEDEPAEFTVDDASGDDWDRLRLDARPSYASVGEAGVFTMFFYPYYDSQGGTQLVPARDFFNFREGTDQLRQVDPFNYNSSYSHGWDGDKLAVYTSETAGENETGYVWKTVWDSERDAEEFVDGYRQVLEYNGASAVGDRANTWRIEGDEFGDAFYVDQQGDEVVIVNAPTVSDLSGVREGAAPEQ